MRSILRPDGFAIGLLLVGVVMLIVPLMVIPGFIAVLSACVYWLVMVVAKTLQRPRTGGHNR